MNAEIFERGFYFGAGLWSAGICVLVPVAVAVSFVKGILSA